MKSRIALQKLVAENGLLLQSFSDVQHKIDAMMAGVVAGLWGMVVLGLVVAAFGVANTFTMTVLEQTREFGLLRVVAMTRNQVRKTIFAQALMMGLLALSAGRRRRRGRGLLDSPRHRSGDRPPGQVRPPSVAAGGRPRLRLDRRRPRRLAARRTRLAAGA